MGITPNEKSKWEQGTIPLIPAVEFDQHISELKPFITLGEISLESKWEPNQPINIPPLISYRDMLELIAEGVVNMEGVTIDDARKMLKDMDAEAKS